MPTKQSNLISAGMLARAVSACREVVAPTKQPDIPAVPMLVVDAYWQDLARGAYPGAWNRIAALTAPEVYPDQAVAEAGGVRAYHGVIIKATQGTRYLQSALAWFREQWPAIAKAREGAGRDRGDFMRGCYHYLMFTQDGAAQAEYYARTVERAGGWQVGDIRPIVDIEFGGPSASNRTASRQQVIDCAWSFSAAIKRITGHRPILYGGSALASLRIKDRLGCQGLWPAAYTRSLKAAEATSIGWTPDEIVMWQYTDGTKGSAVTRRGTRLPIGIPPTISGARAGAGVLPLDCSVITRPSLYDARIALTGAP